MSGLFVVCGFDFRQSIRRKGGRRTNERDQLLDQGRSPDVVVPVAVLHSKGLGLRRGVEQSLAGGQGDDIVEIAVEKELRLSDPGDPEIGAKTVFEERSNRQV